MHPHDGGREREAGRVGCCGRNRPGGPRADRGSCIHAGCHPLRFVWDMDADGRFTVASDEFHPTRRAARRVVRPAVAGNRRHPAARSERSGDPRRSYPRNLERHYSLVAGWPRSRIRSAAADRTFRASHIRSRPQLSRLSRIRRLSRSRPITRMHAQTAIRRRSATVRQQSPINRAIANGQSLMHRPRRRGRRHRPPIRLWRMWCRFGPLRRQSQRPRRPLARSNAKRFANWRKN